MRLNSRLSQVNKARANKARANKARANRARANKAKANKAKAKSNEGASLVNSVVRPVLHPRFPTAFATSN